MPTVILRSLTGRIGVALVGLATLYPVLSIWLADGYGNGLRALSLAACLIVSVWLLWWRPEMRLGDDALAVRNAWRSYRLAWETTAAAPTRWGLTLETAAGRVGVSACPRGGLFTAMRHERRQPQAREEFYTPRVDATSPTFHAHLDCDDAAYLLDLYQAARAEHTGPSTATEFGRWEPLPIAMTAVALVSVVLTFAAL